ncbi:MAG TPA: BON domain-containing protein [Pirellulales bacterium]|nr:BON domain-containing protein [Pirellulales bacterium]
MPLFTSSDDLTHRARLFLAATNLPNLRRIRVDLAGDVVVLSGRVPSFYERQTAVERVRRVAGVFQVADQIEVVGMVGTVESSLDHSPPTCLR